MKHKNDKKEEEDCLYAYTRKTLLQMHLKSWKHPFYKG